MKDSFEVEQRLAEAIAWCSLKVNLSHVDRCLRTPLLCPPLLQGDGDEFELAKRLIVSEEQTQAAVEFVCQQRRAALMRQGVEIQPVNGSLRDGRLLCSNFESDFCAIASHCCKGFFDLADVPAWDGWFWHCRTGVLGGLVYSWVPGVLTDLVSSGIECMPVESSWWVDSFEWLGD